MKKLAITKPSQSRHSTLLDSLNKPLKIPIMLGTLLMSIPLTSLLSKSQTGQFPLLGLHFEDLVLDRVLDDQADDFAGAGLAETVHTVDGLVFDRRCPPGVAEDDLHRC